MFDIVLVGYNCDYKRMPTHHAKHYIVVLIAKFKHTQKLKGNIKTKKTTTSILFDTLDAFV